MKLKNAKTCNNCRASEGRNECSIGYQCTDWTPLEPCPKPKTIQQLIDFGKKPVDSIMICNDCGFVKGTRDYITCGCSHSKGFN